MHEFKDAEGRTWQIKATIGTLRRVKDGAEVDLTDPKSVAAIGADPWKFAAALTELVKDQLDAQGVTPEGFAAALDGPTCEAATEALLAELVGFTHSRERPAWEKMLAKQNQLQAQAVRAVTTLYDGDKLNQKLAAELKRIDAELDSTSGSGSSDSPESPESIPSPSPSDSSSPGPKPG